MKRGILYGVGVGPGDPELITRKAQRIIAQAAVLAVPDKGSGEKTALTIAGELAEGKEILLCDAPMVRDEAALDAAYEANADRVCALLDGGKDVAFLTLGDPTVYSTYLYLHRKVTARGYEAEIIPGVPSFCAVAARLGAALCEKSERLLIVPASHKDVDDCLDVDANLVFMKAGREIGALKEKLAEKGKKFAYIGVTDKDEAVGACRKKGFMDAIHKAKLEVVPERMKIGSFTMDSGYEMAKELFEEEPSIDSLVCATDTMAVGAMTYLKEIGLRIPEDVQIAGIGDGVPGKIVEPKLTTVHFYYKTSGRSTSAEKGYSAEKSFCFFFFFFSFLCGFSCVFVFVLFCWGNLGVFFFFCLYCFFVLCCVMAEQTQKNARFFLRYLDWFVCFASVLMEYVQF